MMKKWTGWILAVCLALCACGSSAPEKGAVETAESAISGESKADAQTEAQAAVQQPDPAVDYDLTVLNTAMAYAHISELVQNADKNAGKTVKLMGLFNAYYIESSNRMYIACEIPDATGCCMQGIEFDLGSGFTYPDDYPKIKQLITVTGTFDTYQEDGSTFGILKDAVVK